MENKGEAIGFSIMALGVTAVEFEGAKEKLDVKFFNEADVLHWASNNQHNFNRFELATYAHLMPESLSPWSIRALSDLHKLKGEGETVAIVGLPFYNSYRKLQTFVPLGAEIVKLDKNGQSAGIDIITEGPIFQIGSVATGQKNMLMEPNTVTEYNASFRKDEPLWVPAINLSLDNAEIVRVTEGRNFIDILPKDEFAATVAANYKEFGICGDVGEREAVKNMQPLLFNYKDNQGKNWQIGICGGYEEIAKGSKVVDLTALPKEIQENFYKDSLHANFPKDIYAVIGFKDEQFNQILNNQAYSTPPLLIGGWFAVATGACVFAKSWHDKWHRSRQKAISVTPSGNKVMDRVVKPQPKRENKEPVKLINSEKKENNLPFIMEVGNVRHAYRDPSEFSSSWTQISLKSDTPKDLKRLIETSSKEVEAFIRNALSYKGDHRTIREFLNRRASRFSILELGGDTVTVSYKSGDYGYYLLDVNLEAYAVQLEYWEDAPKIPAIEARRLQKAKLESVEVIDQDKRSEYSLDEVANEIVGKIEELVSSNLSLSRETFETRREKCMDLINKYTNDSRIKKEVIRKLANSIIEKPEIAIFEGDVKSNVYRGYARTIARNLYDYLHYDEPNIGEIKYNAFTQTAKNLLDQKKFMVLKKTAAKSWVTRTGYRIQIVQVETQENKRRIATIFTHHDH